MNIPLAAAKTKNKLIVKWWARRIKLTKTEDCKDELSHKINGLKKGEVEGELLTTDMVRYKFPLLTVNGLVRASLG
jgi:hypothetical protein